MFERGKCDVSLWLVRCFTVAHAMFRRGWCDVSTRKIGVKCLILKDKFRLTILCVNYLTY